MYNLKEFFLKINVLDTENKNEEYIKKLWELFKLELESFHNFKDVESICILISELNENNISLKDMAQFILYNCNE